MPSLTDCSIRQIDHTFLIYDATLLTQASLNLLNPQWLEQHAAITAVASGRGEAWFVDYDQQHWVLRHYMRGGLVAHVNKQSYLGWRLNQTRAAREWQLLEWMVNQKLPVPKPIAASVCWPYGRLSGVYQASILLQRIPATKTLAACLKHAPVSEETWQSIGQCIRQFHELNVYHADLNANNILINDQAQVYLIDFDRGEIKTPGGWKQANLDRLKRSLLKLQANNDISGFNENQWSMLIQAYEANISL